MSQKQDTLSEYAAKVKGECKNSTPEGVVNVIAAQRRIADGAQIRIDDEGAVVRNLKGDVIPHPAIKIMAGAQKIETGLLSRYGAPPRRVADF